MEKQLLNLTIESKRTQNPRLAFSAVCGWLLRWKCWL